MKLNQQSEAMLALQRHYTLIKEKRLMDLFDEDARRFEKFAFEACGFLIDVSKNWITEPMLVALEQLAQERILGEKIEALFSGGVVNYSEDQAADHVLLRDLSLLRSQDALNQIERWVVHIQQQGITDVVHLGAGGSELGPRFVCDVFECQHDASTIATHFLSTHDRLEVEALLKKLNPKTTLFLVASKSLLTQETLNTLALFQGWLSACFDAAEAQKHLIVITADADRARSLGIADDYTAVFWPTVGGRYSLWSCVGLVIALKIGVSEFRKMLACAAQMDEHFKTTPWSRNVPVLLAFLSFWYSHFFGYETQAIIPYGQRLRLLPVYLQQLHMESLGKSVTEQGEPVDYHTGQILWGGVGTDSQHSFHQLFMQGTRKAPIDFILPLAYNHQKIDNHLIANCLAQSEALMIGNQAEDPYRCILGDYPSTTIVMPSLDAASLGALIALYEHKVFASAVFWGINPFDQWGVCYAKHTANEIFSQLTGSVRAQQNASTVGLIQWIRAHD